MIDTHQHLLDPSKFSYSWTREITALHRRFALEEYREATRLLPIKSTIFMEADVDAPQSAEEAMHFCKLAERAENHILGVVAAARPESQGFEAFLDRISHPQLKGIRRVLHTQPDDLSESTLFRKNITALARRKLTFDLCLLERQLPKALALADACPDTQFILDHCGVPDIAANAPAFWREQIAELAKRPHVACKVSGLLLYAGHTQRTPEGIFPWFAHVVECFGWDRLVWGGDWPVCTLAVPLSTWVETTHSLLHMAHASPHQQNAFLHDNAIRFYNL